MAQKILITKFSYSLPAADFKAVLSSVADEFAKVPGCLWKIWLIDEQKSEGGAIYLFESEKALATFKDSPLVAMVLSHPALSNFDLRATDVLEDLSEITRAPLMPAAHSW
jgi:hypothetical protein